MLSALLLGAAIAAADTQPVIMLAGAPRAPSKPLSPVASAMARPKRFNADSIVIDKSQRSLKLYQRGAEVLSYDVALGPNPVGAKTRRGDGRTPEGLYYLEGRNPQSKYHLALRVSYPNDTDRARAAQRGVSPGGDIMIHGLPNGMGALGKSHLARDWTEGCIAVTNGEIEEIWSAVADGTPIEIRP